ncbi:hypothetical protein MtrunA17_Chr8g0384681 [Medicago truncatula]|uniref:Transmembrane protein n=1 Tax=Medicago truncatula TaxID=3880 RepID=A0A396GSL2_MEDTR|nr:hypothetical protein MtrunA17_Chr8g0384681 [Medicago truncatula]
MRTLWLSLLLLQLMIFSLFKFQEICCSLGQERSIGRLDNHIMKALCRLNELGGSSKTTIASFKVKGRYRIAPTPAYSDRGRHQPMLLLEGGRKASYEI